jgi:hypothetical protein
MDTATPLKLAIELMQCPSQARAMRSAPLPDGVLILLRIAAGDEEATKEASASVSRPRDIVREAAAFFIEQILLHPGADSYRVLGTRAGVSHDELRRNMGLLLRWLHPDLDPNGERTVFTTRVTRAWNDLKTEGHRVAYDRSQRMASAEASLLRQKGNTRAHSRRGVKTRRQSGRVGHHRRIVFPPFIQRHLEPGGLLHRVLLLFGRAVL